MLSQIQQHKIGHLGFRASCSILNSKLFHIYSFRNQKFSTLNYLYYNKMDSLKFYDIAFNLTDDMYKGIYNGTSPKHPQDHSVVLKRAFKHGVEYFMLTSVNIQSCIETLEYAKRFGDSSKFDNENNENNESYEEDEDMNKFRSKQRVFCTIGVHPTHCSEFLKDKNSEEIDEEYTEKQLESIYEMAKCGKQEGIVIAIGEIGLDYARESFCPRKIQQYFLEKQLEIGRKLDLPYFLHNRDSASDLYNILINYQDVISKNGAVVHSFDGTIEELKLLLSIENLYIGLNGCSFRTKENIETVKEIPLDRIMLETDSPWCEVRPSHEGSKYRKTIFSQLNRKEKYTLDTNLIIKGRNEPCTIVQVAEIIAGIKNLESNEVARIAFENSLNIFFPKNTI